MTRNVQVESSSGTQPPDVVRCGFGHFLYLSLVGSRTQALWRADARPGGRGPAGAVTASRVVSNARNACPAAAKSRWFAILGATIGLLAGGPTHAAPDAIAAPSGALSSPIAMQIVTIPSNAQATVGDVRIGAGNIWDDEYTDVKGDTRKGLTAGLWIYFRDDKARDTKRRVHPGESFVIGRYRFEVLSVESDQVTLRLGPASP